MAIELGSRRIKARGAYHKSQTTTSTTKASFDTLDLSPSTAFLTYLGLHLALPMYQLDIPS